MINILTTVLLITVLFLTGKIFESVRRLFALIVTIVLKLLNLLGIKVDINEKVAFTSRKFKNTFKDIKKVKQSKLNEKIVPSINIFALFIFIFCVVAIVVNLTQNMLISNWLYSEVDFIHKVFNSVDLVDTTFTAVMFSILAFSISKLVNLWKLTAKYRKAKRDMKLRKRVLSNMSSKELLDLAKLKDEDVLSKLKSMSNDDDSLN